MRYPAAKYLIAVLGLVGISLAAPDRIKWRITDSERAAQLYNEFFNEPVNTLSTAGRLNADSSSAVLPSCLCVSHLRCSINRIPGSNKIIVDKRLGDTCSDTLDVCCPRASIITETVPTTVVNNGNTRLGCGFRNPSGIGVRISGSENSAQFAEFPWMVVVLRKTFPGAIGNYMCGGSLIHPQVVLTAAHTIEEYAGRPGDLLVRAGDWDATSRSEPILHQEREVEAVILHENFDRDNLNNDIAILILKTVYDTAPNVNTICLPRETDVFDAKRCTATGWGKNTFESHGRFQAVLKKVELPVVPFGPCQSSLRLTRLTDTFNLDQSFICAGGEPGRDTCSGDGGSPLVCPLPNAQDQYVQAGIVSWGIGCGQDQVPGVYASVPFARPWIDRTLARYSIYI